jgi:hypothetical protein
MGAQELLLARRCGDGSRLWHWLVHRRYRVDRLRTLFFEETQKHQLFVKRESLIRLTRIFCALIAAMGSPVAASACSACFGKSDSSMALGMNWGIFSLLGVVVSVLGSVAGFFVYLARKSAALSAANMAVAAGSAPAAEPAQPAELEHEHEQELVGAPD